MSAFADFLGPLDETVFLSQYYGKRPVHIRRGDAARPDILTWARFNEALSLSPYWTEETLKLFYQNREALRDNYCDTADLRPGRAAPVNPAKARALIGLGASVVANHLHRVSGTVREAAHLLERQFAARVFANVYCSFSGVQAFQTHFDLHDVFAVQAEGEKTWRIYEARADAPVQALPPGEQVEKWLISSRGRLLFEAHMRPGDVLYLPRGQYHDALTADGASLHVTFGVSPATGLSLFKLLEKALNADRSFRAYMPDARDGAAMAAHLEALAERVKAVMVSPAFAADVALHQRGLAGADQTFDLPAQHRPMWFQMMKPARVVRRDAGHVLVCDGREFALGGAFAAAEWFCQLRHFSVEDALARHPGTARAELMAVLGELAQAGVVAESGIQ